MARHRNWLQDSWRHRNAAAQQTERERLGHMLRPRIEERNLPPRKVDPTITMPMVAILKEEWDGKMERPSSGN
jgi:hypothetical protein